MNDARLLMVFFRERVLILGSGPLAQGIAEVIGKSRRGSRILGFVADRTDKLVVPAVSREDLLGALEDLVDIIDTTRPSRMVVALTEARDNLPIRELVGSHINGITVEHWLEAYERSTGKVAIEQLAPDSVVFCRTFKRHQHAVNLRRGLDVVVGLVGLILTAPLMAMSAMAIKLESNGPVFFVQKRLGYNGQAFDMLKFRTMHPVSGTTSEWARDNDDRVTRIGGILRRYRLDELPQFLNILRGEMTLIGPRPHPVTNVSLFEKEIAYYMIRDLVRPGITGWSQVRLGYANNLEEEIEKMRYDLYYIKYQSLWFDLQILLETIRIVLFGRGATTRLPDDSYTRIPEHEPSRPRVAPKGVAKSKFNGGPRVLVNGQAVDPQDDNTLSMKRGRVSDSGNGWTNTAEEEVNTDGEPQGEGMCPGQLKLFGSAGWAQKLLDPTDLYFYSAIERRMITAEIRTQLAQEPLVETRNRKQVQDNPVASWELRADKYRIFYEAQEASREVTIVAVGHRENNRLFVRGEEVLL